MYSPVLTSSITYRSLLRQRQANTSRSKAIACLFGCKLQKRDIGNTVQCNENFLLRRRTVLYFSHILTRPFNFTRYATNCEENYAVVKGLT